MASSMARFRKQKEDPAVKRYPMSFKSQTETFQFNRPDSCLHCDQFPAQRTFTVPKKETYVLHDDKVRKLSKPREFDMERIETEYIKNLQQQVYFLELESNYLREQACKANDRHPHMVQEAEKMLDRLKEMSLDFDNMKLQMAEKQASVDLIQHENDLMQDKFKEQEETNERRRDVLRNELVKLNRERDLLEQELRARDVEIAKARDELRNCASAFRTTETRIGALEAEITQKDQQLELLENTLDEKRTLLAQAENDVARMQDEVKTNEEDRKAAEGHVNKMAAEIAALEQIVEEAKLTEKRSEILRLQLEKDLSKSMESSADLHVQLARSNHTLKQEVDRREAAELRNGGDSKELLQLRDRDKEHELKAEQREAEIARQKTRIEELTEQIGKVEDELADQRDLNHTAQTRIDHLQGLLAAAGDKESKMKEEKQQLVDHSADLQKQLNDKDREILAMHAHVHEMETKLKELDYLKGLESALHSQKWEEFSQLADSMSCLSRTLSIKQMQSTPVYMSGNSATGQNSKVRFDPEKKPSDASKTGELFC